MKIEDLNLAPVAEAAARLLQQKRPNIVFTSGRRTVFEQARAMASNIVASGNRRWIEQTYAKSDVRDALQGWVDAHPRATTQDQLARGLETTMNALPMNDLGKI